MRAALCGLLALIAVMSVGCHHNCRGGRRGHVCNSCGHGHGGGLRAGMPSHVARLPHGYMEQQMAGPQGPPTPTVAYPYYTTRAPRDFLLDNPPGIGP
jgi:hypothetical protein